MNPRIVMKSKPVNPISNYNDLDFDINEEELELYHVIVSEDKLKICFTVAWRDPKFNSPEFKVVKEEHLYLDGHDKDSPYPPVVVDGIMSADPTITQEIFKKNLEPYGISLTKVVNHGFAFFESTDYIFTDQNKKDKLHSLINKACQKLKHNPASLG